MSAARRTAAGLLLAGLLLPVARAQEPAAAGAEGWSWPAHLTSAQVARLTPLRDRCLERLHELGPSPEERLAAVAVDEPTRTRIRAAIHQFSYFRQNQGSAELIRRGRRDRLVAEFGVRAVPYLCEVLGSERYWSARVAAQALGLLARGEQADEVRWLAHHLEAPLELITSFGGGPDVGLPGRHRELDATLHALLATAPAEPLTLSESVPLDQVRREGEAAQAAWLAVWVTSHARWLEREHARERERRELLRRLDLLRRGIDPASLRPEPGEEDEPERE